MKVAHWIGVGFCIIGLIVSISILMVIGVAPDMQLSGRQLLVLVVFGALPLPIFMIVMPTAALIASCLLTPFIYAFRWALPSAMVGLSKKLTEAGDIKDAQDGNDDDPSETVRGKKKSN